MKNLIFIPYQDIYDFTNSEILTREYSILNFFIEQNIENYYFISKPRTALDKKKMKNTIFPEESIEFKVLEKIKISKKIRYETVITLKLFSRKRGWWIDGYRKTIELLTNENIDYKNSVVYCNNPFAIDLLRELKEQGAIIYFDMMDNLSVHPSLNEFEQETSKKLYEQAFEISDFKSCNSKEIQLFCEEEFEEQVILIKNGVFPATINIKNKTREVNEKYTYIKQLSSQYKQLVGYVGKLGLRLDDNLIKTVANKNPDSLFVFIGPHLKGQKNNKLIDVFDECDNVISVGSIPSCYIYDFLELFDILTIPHAVGEYENGGDPLKLYQYLNSKKPIITTNIAGVDEFKDYIEISNDPIIWNSFLQKNKSKEKADYQPPKSIYWSERLEPLLSFIENKGDDQNKNI